MGFSKAVRRNLQEAPLHLQAWRARRQGKRSAGGTYHVVIPIRTFKVYREHLLSIVDCLEALGRHTILHPVKRFSDVGQLHEGDRVIAFAPYRLEAFEPQPGVLYVCVNSEQYPEDPGELQDGLHGRGREFMDRCHLVFECHEALYEKAKSLGLQPAGVLPFAYSPRWDWKAWPERPRYDVAFLGRFSGDHRKELWSEIAERFRACPRTEAWGGQRPRFLRDAKIQLSFSQTEVAQLGGHRFAMALANKCFVLSEPLPPASPFTPGEHFGEASAAGMIDTIARYLDADAERKRIAEAGHRFFTIEYRLETFIQRMIPKLDLALEDLQAGRTPGT